MLYGVWGVVLPATWCWENIRNSGKFVLHFYLPFGFLVQLMLAVGGIFFLFKIQIHFFLLKRNPFLKLFSHLYMLLRINATK